MPGIPIPNDVKVALLIGQGSVYRFSPQNDVINHYYVVVNRSPKDDETLYLVYFTTKKDKISDFISTRGLHSSTMVEINHRDCPFLPNKDNGCINCNSLLEINKSELIERINESNGSCGFPKVPGTVLSRIIEGIKNSRLVKPKVKELI